MWAWLYIAIGAFATVMTWGYAVREQAAVFTTSIATVAWSVLALQRDVTVVASNGSTTALEMGAVRFLLAALALLSLVAFVGAVLGIYPESHPDDDTFTNTQT